MTWVKCKIIMVHLEIVLISMQDRYTVYAERAMGSELILGALMELLGDVGQVEAHFC